MEATVHQAKTELSRLIERALAGEEVVIARGRKPLVRLVPVAPVPEKRQLGSFTGEYFMADDFQSELQDFADYLPAAPLPTNDAKAPSRRGRSVGETRRKR